MSQDAVVNKSMKVKAAFLDGFIYDHVLIVGITVIALISGFIVVAEPSLFVPILLLDLWFLGYHHVISTFTKLAGTKQDRAENKFFLYYLPFIVLAGVYALYAVGNGIWTIVSVYFFWQWYHYTRQSYGISVFYRRKAKIEDSNTPVKLDYAMIWAVPIWGVIHRCGQDWDTFIGLPFWTPDIPFELSYVAGTICLFVVGAWIFSKILDFFEGKLAYAPVLFVLSHNLVFFIAYVYIVDITYGWLVVNIWHNAQYILFVWLFNQNRFKGDEKKSLSPVLHWLCQKTPYRTFMYFFVCLVITSIVYNALGKGLSLISGEDMVLFLALQVVLFQTLNFHHYVVDSFIWKARKKSNQKIMKVD